MTNSLLEIAKDLGAQNWLAEESNRGWYTCLITGKKFRGDDAEEIQAEMDRYVKVINAAENEQEAMGEVAMMEDQVEEFNNEIDNAVVDLEQEEETMTHRLENYIAMRAMAHGGHPKGIKLVSINCADCDEERIIKVQDLHQVKRCVSCQKKHRNRVRAEKRRAKRAAEKALAQQ